MHFNLKKLLDFYKEKSNSKVSYYNFLKKINLFYFKEYRRNYVGGKFDEIGNLQYEIFKELCLRPQSLFLDVGCGCLRGGRYIINYLDKNCYYGIDNCASLIKSGLKYELINKNDKNKINFENNFFVTDNFNIQTNIKFDYINCFSLFTHLNLNYISLVLDLIKKCLRNNSICIATFFDKKDNLKGHYDTRDPFHYDLQTLEALCTTKKLSLKTTNFLHPRKQKIVIIQHA